MAIAFTKYVDISSFVAAGNVVQTRDYISRIFTTNALIPTNSFSEFTTLSSVGDYFGTSSEEYARAKFYFEFVSKTFFSPRKISFASYVNANVAPKIFGSRFSTTLAQFQAITNGSLRLTLGGVSNNLTGIDLSVVASLADVATLLQDAINAETGTQWTAATVVYDASRGAFNFVGGDAVVADVSVASVGTGTDLKNVIGWGDQAIFSNGSLAMTVTETLQASAEASNNFGSFLFMPYGILDLDQITEAATWNASYIPNVSFMYLVPVLRDDASDYAAALGGYAGTVLSEYSSTSGFVEMLPGAIQAATQYDRANSVQNYMYQTDASLLATVTTTQDSDFLDNLAINYYGQTQTAGQNISFYQRGSVCGGTDDPRAINIYANEIWLKDAMAAVTMNGFLLLEEVPANTEGLQIVQGLQQNVINQALRNKSISVGKALNTGQKAEITLLTGDPNAWQQVQNLGYWYSSAVETYLIGSVTNYKIVYTLIYSKDDVVNKVEGQHILI